MMKSKLYIYILIFATLMMSCESYLDKQEDAQTITQDEIFASYLTARDFLDGVYTDLITEMSPVGKNADMLPAMTMSGEGYPGRLFKDFPDVYRYFSAGEYQSLMDKVTTGYIPNFVYRYDRSWEGIRQCCVFLENCDKIADASGTS